MEKVAIDVEDKEFPPEYTLRKCEEKLKQLENIAEEIDKQRQFWEDEYDRAMEWKMLKDYGVIYMLSHDEELPVYWKYCSYHNIELHLTYPVTNKSLPREDLLRHCQSIDSNVKATNLIISDKVLFPTGNETELEAFLFRVEIIGNKYEMY